MRTFVTTTLTLALLVLLQGCDSIVERTEPSTAISQEVALSNPDAIQGVRASMYDWMHDQQLSTDWLLGPSALADDTFFRSNQERHQELNRNLLRAGVGTNAYDEIYNLLNDANILISGIEEGVLPEAEAQKLRAEGLFMRALILHHAVRIFGYDPDGNGGVLTPASGPGSGFNLGVEVRTTPTLSVADATPQARAPVPEVYSQITSDLNEAISIFSTGNEEGSAFYPSQAAAEALMARAQLYQRNWAEADTRAQNAIDRAGATFGSGLATSADELYAIFDETAGNNPEAIFTIDTDPATESAGVNNSIAAFTSMQWVAQLPTQDLIDTYDDGDFRIDAWYQPCFDDINGSAPNGCELINDQGFELRKYAAEQGASRFADDYVHLRIAEMVLIQAEARLNTSGPSAAIDRLNDLRTARGLDAYDGPTSFDDVYDAILLERRRELVAEGHRFFDLKRLGRDIEKTQGRDDIPFSDFRLLDDFPPNQLSVNPELQQNPGY